MFRTPSLIIDMDLKQINKSQQTNKQTNRQKATGSCDDRVVSFLAFHTNFKQVKAYFRKLAKAAQESQLSVISCHSDFTKFFLYSKWKN